MLPAHLHGKLNVMANNVYFTNRSLLLFTSLLVQSDHVCCSMISNWKTSNRYEILPWYFSCMCVIQIVISCIHYIKKMFLYLKCQCLFSEYKVTRYVIALCSHYYACTIFIMCHLFHYYMKSLCRE